MLEPAPVLMAQRGDAGVIERDGVISSGVFTSAAFTVYGKEKTVAGSDLQFLPIPAFKTAFQVR